MSDLEQQGPRRDGATDDELGAEPITGLLKSALSAPPVPEKSLLPGIQHRIYVQSRGRYFRDRRAKMRDPYLWLLMAALLILVIAAVAFVALNPLMDDSKKSGGQPPAGEESSQGR